MTDSQKTPVQRILILVSGALFLLSGAGIFIGSLMDTKSPPTTTQPSTETVEALKKKEQGYVTVLEREPKNPLALQGLVETRLQMNDLQGAIVPLDELIKLYPQEQVFKTLRQAIEERMSNPTPPTK